MTEAIFIGLLFLVAVFYLGRKVYLSFRVDKGCSKGCGCADTEVAKVITKGK